MSTAYRNLRLWWVTLLAIAGSMLASADSAGRDIGHKPAFSARCGVRRSAEYPARPKVPAVAIGFDTPTASRASLSVEVWPTVAPTSLAQSAAGPCDRMEIPARV